MRCFSIIPLVLGSILLGPSLAIAQAPDQKSDLAANAAIQYWQAFAQMPTLDKDQEKLLEQWNTVSLSDPAVQKLIAASHNSLMYLHRAAGLTRCDWGLDYNDGMSLMLPHLAKARDLARLAALRGRQEFERGDRKSARTDATAIMTLGRHVGRDPFLVCVLLRYGIEGLTIDLVAPYVPELKASYSQAAAMFDGLPPAATVHQTLATEKQYMAEWMIKKLKEEEHRQKGAGFDLFKKILDGPDVPEALKQVKSFEVVIKLSAEVPPVYDELAKLVALPKKQFDSQYPAFKQQTKAAHPMAGLILPSVDQILAKEQRNQARLAMLLASIAVAEGGPDKLKEIKDPFGTGPFEYRALDKGFELKSQLLFEDQAVTLTVGQRK